MTNAIAFLFSCSVLAMLAPRLAALRDITTLFLLLAIWARIFLSSMGSIAFIPVTGGLYVITVLSMAVVAVGLLLLPWRLVFTGRFLLFALFLFFVVFSGLFNSPIRVLISEMSRWLLFVVLFLCCVHALQKFSTEKILDSLMWILAIPLVLQMISVLLGDASFAGDDGARQFKAGFAGGGLLSYLLLALLFVVAIRRWRNEFIPLTICMLCIAGITLANYRTTVLATLPILFVLIFSASSRWAPAAARPLVLVFISMCAVLAAPIMLVLVPERYGELFVFFEELPNLFKPPYELTETQYALLTGRVGIWSEYIYAWFNADWSHRLFGFGPDAYEQAGLKISHNAFISILYEFGIVGLSIVLAIFAFQFLMILRIDDKFVAVRLFAAFGGFTVLSMATNTLWAVEALLGFAILCAVTWVYSAGLTTDSQQPFTAPTRRIGEHWRAPPLVMDRRRRAGIDVR